jgi:hypothetical protein
VLQLAPLAVVSEKSDSMLVSAPNLNSTTSWNWQRLEGRGTAVLGGCDASGSPALEDEKRSGTVEWAMLPLVTLPKAFRADGWKTTSPGHCSAGAPFTTFGKPSKDQDASLRAVLATPTELYVQVRDDVFVEHAASWVLADHLELWTSDEFGSPTESCLGRKGGDQWGIALDGATTRGFGTQAAAPVVEVARADGVVRFKLTLAEAPNSLTLVYSDTDDGKKQKRLISTSTFKYAQPATMGRAFTVAPSRAECVQQGGELVPRGTQQFTPDTAVLE